MSKENKSSRTLYLFVSAIALIALGVVVIIYRGTVAKEFDWIIKWVAATIFAVIGVVNLIPFIKDRSKENVKNLIIGVLCIIAAILLLVIAGLLFRVIGILLGIYLIIEGFYKTKASIDSKKGELKAWFVPLIFGIISILIGAFSLYLGIFSPFEVGAALVFGIGVMLIYAGIQNFVNLFFGKKN